MDEKIIKEEQGVSEEVRIESEKIIDTFDDWLSTEPNVYNPYIPYVELRDRRFINVFNFGGNPIFGKVIQIVCIVYDFNSNEEVLKYIQEIPMENHTETIYINETSYVRILFTLISINKTIRNQNSIGFVYHEMLHAFQVSKILKTENINLYWAANIIQARLKKNEVINKSIVAISYLILYYHDKEIYANMQSLYSQLKFNNIKTKEALKRTAVYNQYKFLDEKYYNDAFSDDSEKTLLMIKNTYGKNKQSLKRYIDDRRQYFKEKCNQVLSRFLTEEKLYEQLNRYNYVPLKFIF